MDIFVELSLLIAAVTFVSFLMKVLRQPFIVGYILTGILVGPYVFNLLRSHDDIEFFSKIGLTILLYIVGLGLNTKVLHEVGKVSLVTGLSQVVITALVGFGICLLLGMDLASASYVSIALTFSSTIIVMKLLTDKGDIDSLYGKISVGFMLVQDLVATVILIVVASLDHSQGESVWFTLGLLVVKAFVVTSVIALLSRKVLPRLINFAASKQELLFIFSLAWGMIMASVFSLIGFSVEIGALVAGVALSTSPYTPEIGSRMKPLRDFFILLFFILLGSQLDLTAIPRIIVPALVLSAFVLIGKPLIVHFLMNIMGFRRKTGFMAGLTVAQVSEFSLILVSLGVSVGHVQSEMLSLVTLVGLLTIAGSSYLLFDSESIYRLVKKLLKLMELRHVSKDKYISIEQPAEVVLFGFDRAGTDLLKALEKLEKHYVIVDYNPKSIDRLKALGLPYAYGDADDVEFLEELGIHNAKLIISTIPYMETNKLLVKHLRKANPDAIIIVLSHNIPDTLELYDLGASYVIMPVYLGAEYAYHMIVKHGLDSASFSEERRRHMQHLERRLKSI